MSFYEFPIKLWTYFQLTGTLSVLASCAVVYLLVRAAKQERMLPTLGAAAIFTVLIYFAVDTFEYAAVLYLVGWSAFGMLLVIFAIARRRVPVGTLTLVYVAWLLAMFNSNAVSEIRAKPSEAALQAAELQRQEAEQKRKDAAGESTEPGINFGENASDKDGSDDKADSDTDESAKDAGNNDGNAEAGDDSEPASDDAGKIPAYRRQGKVERKARTKTVNEDIDPTATEDDSDNPNQNEELSQAVDDSIRELEEADVYRAQDWDRANLFVVRTMFLVVVVWLLGEYLRRFNSTFDPIFPLPISGRFVDAIAPKRLTVLLRSSDAGRVKEILDRAVAKGETFMYFGPHDPWQDDAILRVSPRTTRVVIGGLFLGGMLSATISRYGVLADWRRVALEALATSPVWSGLVIVAVVAAFPLVTKWKRCQKSLTKLQVNETAEVPGSEFVLESVWFDRYCFSIVGQATAQEFLADLVRFLQMRTIPHARTRQSVNVVWNFPTAPDRSVIDDLKYLGNATNFKLLVSVPDGEGLDELFDEISPDVGDSQPDEVLVGERTEKSMTET